MKELFVPYPQSLELRELGFDEKCLRVGNPHGHTMWKWIEVDGEPPTVNINDIIEVAYDEEWTQIPTFSQAFRWFREKYNKIDYPEFDYEEQKWFCHSNYKFSKIYFNTYDEAELTCLVKLIEIVKENQQL